MGSQNHLRIKTQFILKESHMNTALLLILIWLASGLIVIYISSRRGIKFGLKMDLALAFLGPFAIPLALMAKRK
jgi:hypothetical protein